jgi:rubrerythrin
MLICGRSKESNPPKRIFRKPSPEIETAKAEGNKEAERTFHFANEVEKIHAALYQQMLDTLEKTKESSSYYVCPVCGYTVEKEAPETCPVCGAKGKMFKKVD